MLKTRVITAIIGFITAVIAITLGGVIFNALIGLLALLGWREYCIMLRNKQIYIPMAWGFLFTFLILVALALSSYSLVLIFTLTAIMVLGLLYIFSSEENHFTIGTVAFSCFGLFYSIGGFAALMMLRNNDFFHQLALGYGDEPAVAIIWVLLFSTWASDTFAYFAGRAWGKHKIVPKISPNKTLEGFIGGFIGCVITGMVIAFLEGLPVDLGFAIGMLTGIFAPLGDLFESKIKRSCNVKDSGVLLPGHGGVLDRFDSLIFTAPIAIIYLLLEAL